MTMYVYNSLSPGAPQLNGSPGSLVAIMNYCLITGMGWASAYTATNQAAYRQPAGTNGMYLNIDDSVGQNARVCGFETMSAILVGVNQFPPVYPLGSGGGYVFKSNTADTVSRPWSFFSDGKLIHFYYCNSGSVSGAQMNPSSSGNVFTFGDFLSFKIGDAFNTILICENSANSNASYQTSTYAFQALFNAVGQVGVGIARPATQIGSSFTASRWLDYGGGADANYFGKGALPYPCAIDGGINISKYYLGENIGRRGVLPGFWSWMHNSYLNPYDTFNGAGALAGRSFIALQCPQGGSFILETSDTWSS